MNPMTTMNWDDLRFVVALSRAGTLAKAARSLGVDQTTVGRRIEAAERALSVHLFTRSTAGYVLTAEGERLLDPLQRVEDSVHAVLRSVQARDERIEGVVRLTSPETFGVAWLAPRLGELCARHAGLAFELVPSGAVMDLVRREADIAIRLFRTRHASLVVRRFATVAYGIYATASYLRRRPVAGPADLARHALLLPSSGVELAWVKKLAPAARAAVQSELSLGLLEAARADAGLAALPRYLGDAATDLVHVPMPEAPSEALWLTVHKDLRTMPRVRRVLDYLVEKVADDERGLLGA